MTRSTRLCTTKRPFVAPSSEKSDAATSARNGQAIHGTRTVHVFFRQPSMPQTTTRIETSTSARIVFV